VAGLPQGFISEQSGQLDDDWATYSMWVHNVQQHAHSCSNIKKLSFCWIDGFGCFIAPTAWMVEYIPKYY
jgi:hypothetical protein